MGLPVSKGERRGGTGELSGSRERKEEEFLLKRDRDYHPPPPPLLTSPPPQLALLTGVAALLRFPMPELEDIDMGDSSSDEG